MDLNIKNSENKYSLIAFVGDAQTASSPLPAPPVEDLRFCAAATEAELREKLASEFRGADRVAICRGGADKTTIAAAIFLLGKLDGGASVAVAKTGKKQGLFSKLLALVFGLGVGKLPCADALSSPIYAIDAEMIPLFINIKAKKTSRRSLLIPLLAKAISEKKKIEAAETAGAGGENLSPRKTRFIPTAFAIFFASKSLKFLFSSCVALAIDYSLLLILNTVFPTFEIGAVIAWVCSSMTNFFINRYFVFEGRGNFWLSAGEYYALAGVVFVIKTFVLLELFTRVFMIPLAIAKIIAEVVMFVSNYFVQKKFIFRDFKSKNKNKTKKES